VCNVYPAEYKINMQLIHSPVGIISVNVNAEIGKQIVGLLTLTYL